MLSLSHFSFQTYAQFIVEYKNYTENQQKSGYQEAPYGYDSVWTIANMLNKSVQIMKAEGRGGR